MDNTEWAYLAGLFDSDGCVVVGRSRRSSGSVAHRLQVHYTQVDRAFLQNWRDRVGRGSVGCISSGTCWAWVLGGDSAAELMERCMPYLMVKHAEAGLAVAFQAGRALCSEDERDGYWRALQEAKLVREVRIPERSGPMQDIDYAYLAGLVDGDGCFSIVRRDRPKLTPTPIYDLWLVVAGGGSWGKALLEYWCGRAGCGSVHCTGKAGRTCRGPTGAELTARLDMYQWRIAGARVLTGLVGGLLPFLVRKKEQAGLLLGCCATFAGQGGSSHGGYGRGSGKKIPAEVLEQREGYRQQIMALNRPDKN